MGSPRSIANRPKRNAGPWSSSRILNSSSPITSKDIHYFLVTCISGWESNYSEEEKRSIIETLPPAYRQFNVDPSGNLQCPITLEFVLEDSFIKASASRFRNDVTDGYYQVQWQNQARRAMREREEGKFDEYLYDYAEEIFGGNHGNGTGNNSIINNDKIDSDDEYGSVKAIDKENSWQKRTVDKTNTSADFKVGSDPYPSGRGRK